MNKATERASISFNITRNYGDSKYCDGVDQYALTVSDLLIGLRNLGGTQHNPERKGKEEARCRGTKGLRNVPQAFEISPASPQHYLPTGALRGGK